MARFYGTVQGGRGEATRLGHATSGLHVTAQSYSGDICVNLNDVDGEDWVWIAVKDHGPAPTKQIYCGPVRKLVDDDARATMLRALVSEQLTA